MTNMIKGSIVAIITPMLDSLEIDTSAFCNLLEMHVKSGTDAIVVNGSTGESATLLEDESIALITMAKEVIGNRMPVIAYTGTSSTATTIAMTKRATKLGIDACLVVTPYYNRPTQEGLYLHYATLADKVDIPIILYNVPTRTGCDLLPETVARLSKIKNIIGIKEATGDISRLEALTKCCEKGFKFYSGDDNTCAKFMEKGGHGVISVAANLVPKLFSDMCSSVLDGRVEQAQKMDENLQHVYKGMQLESNPIPVKWAMQHLGHIKGGIRLPLTTLSLENQQKMKNFLQQANVVS